MLIDLESTNSPTMAAPPMRAPATRAITGLFGPNSAPNPSPFGFHHGKHEPMLN
jgi:hypothetical protein